MSTESQSPVRRVNVIVARLVLGAVVVLGAGGLVLAASGSEATIPALTAACALLVLGPVLNVLAELAEEVRRKDWPFAVAAGVVIVLIAYTALSRL